MRMHFEVDGVGETLVFLHGAFVDSSIWHYQRAYFSAHYRVVTVDLRGHGASDPSQLSSYSVALFSEDILRLMDELEAETFHVCGLSLGSMVAQHLAAHHPERVQSIALVGATVSLRLGLLERMVTTFLFPKWMAMFLFGQLSTRQFMKLSFMLTWFMLGSKWLGNTDTRKRIKESISRVSRAELKKIYAAVHGFRKQQLKNGSFPILILNGSYDSPVIHAHARYVRRQLRRRVTVFTIENAGHACNHDQPLLFNRLLHDWIENQDHRSMNNGSKALSPGEF